MRVFFPAALVAAVLLFGAVFVPYAGVQYDEALFIKAVYNDPTVEHAVKFGDVRVPIMLIEYIGTLKAGVYAALLKMLPANVWTLRVPTLLVAALAVALFYLTIRRVTGTAVAALASGLLATDAVYILTSVFDWGPVAFQHLLFAAALYCGVRYAQEARLWLLFACGLCCGLALWDKALFVWLLAGAGVALTAVFPRQSWALASRRQTALLIAAGFILGALPFLYYNKIHPLATFRGNVQVSGESKIQKIRMLDKTLDGHGLVGYLVRHSPEGFPRDLRFAEKVPLFIATRVVAPQGSWQHLLFAVVLFGSPLLWFTRWRREFFFAYITFLVAWLLSILNPATGGGAHHTILLYPLPHWLLALCVAWLAETWPRRGLQVSAAVIAFCAFSNLLLLNQHLAQFISSGPTAIWTDAIFPLTGKLKDYDGRKFVSVDWGVVTGVRYLSGGQAVFAGREDGITLDFDTPLRDARLQSFLADPSVLFIARAEGKEVFAGTRERFFGYARQHGYQGRMLDSVADRHGSAMFEIWEFRR